MRILIAPDSFKGSMTAKVASQAIAKGVSQVFPAADLVQVPMADGGEGTVTTLVDTTGGQYCQATVHDPLNRLITAQYGIINNGKTAVIETAAASGLQFIDPVKQDALLTTTYGTGELVLAALDQEVDEIIVGLGGSATTDGGAGMAQALGVRLLDSDGGELSLGGGSLEKLARIDGSAVDPRLQKVKIYLASDVTNPLTGANGAAMVFAPQKGASQQDVRQLDRNLHHYARIINRDLGKNIETVAGAGAAGGLGAGFLAFTNAQIKSGVQLVIKYCHLLEKAQQVDLAFTGEGALDFQTQFGKTPAGVAQAVHQVAPTAPVIAVAGKLGNGAEQLCNQGLFTALFSITNGVKDLDQAIKDSPLDLTSLTVNVCRLLKVQNSLQ